MTLKMMLRIDWIHAAITLTLLLSFDEIVAQSSDTPYRKEYIIGHQRSHAAGFCSSSANKNNCVTPVIDRMQARKQIIPIAPLHSVPDEGTETNNNLNNYDKKAIGGGTWNPFSLAVLKLGFTEPAWTSPLNYKNANGIYACANCRSPLFSSSGKYDSGSGWPSFWKTIENNRVVLERNWDGRMECKCANCDGHIGHVFPDGPMKGSLDVNELKTVPESDPKLGYKVQKLGKSDDDAESKYSRMPRFCINGIALRFDEVK